MAPTKKSSSAKAPAKKPVVVKKSQYELERDARIKRNEEWMIAHGFNPWGSGPLKEIKKKAPPRPRTLKKYVPESERRRSPRLAGETIAPKRLTYDLSDDESPKRRSRSWRRTRVRVVDDLSDEQRAALPEFKLDAFLRAFEAWMEPDGEHPVSEQNRRSVIRQVRKLVSGEGVTYKYWPEGVIFRKDEPVTMQSDISAIIDDARDCEDQYGEDRGHGWLLNHPLRKLLFYQHYLDTKARLAPAAKAPMTEPTKATTPTKKAKKAKTSLVGKKVIKAFKGYKNPRDNSPYFDGVVESVEDGKCVIVWEDGDETSMTAAAARKILVEC
jgi:hypothetical protein